MQLDNFEGCNLLSQSPAPGPLCGSPTTCLNHLFALLKIRRLGPLLSSLRAISICSQVCPPAFLLKVRQLWTPLCFSLHPKPQLMTKESHQGEDVRCRTNCRQTACSNGGHTTTSPNAETLTSYKSANLAIQKTSSVFSNLMVCFVQLLNVCSCAR